MRAWWWRSVAACASLAAVAGAVATVATALDADRQTTLAAERAAQAEQFRADQARADQAPRADPPTPSRAAAEQRTSASDGGPGSVPGSPGAARTGDPGLGVSVAVPAGWRRVTAQRLVPAPDGRFPMVLTPNDRAAVMIGALDPARVASPAAPGQLAAEARRLVGAFSDGTDPDARTTTLTDAADTVDGRPAWTSLRRVDGGARDVAGTLVRVTAVEGASRGVVAVAVVRPGPQQAADARAADALVASLDLDGAGARRPPELVRSAPPVPAVGPPRAGQARPEPPRPPAPPTGRPAPRPSSPLPPPARPGEP